MGSHFWLQEKKNKKEEEERILFSSSAEVHIASCNIRLRQISGAVTGRYMS
jgi:hypothetical protein